MKEVLFTSISSICDNCLYVMWIGFKEWQKSLGVCRIWEDIIVKNKLVFSSDLKIISSLELTIFHMIFLHPHKSGIWIGFGETVMPFKCLLIVLIFFSTYWKILLDLTQDFLEFTTLGFTFILSCNGCLLNVLVQFFQFFFKDLSEFKQLLWGDRLLCIQFDSLMDKRSDFFLKIDL